MLAVSPSEPGQAGLPNTWVFLGPGHYRPQKMFLHSTSSSWSYYEPKISVFGQTSCESEKKNWLFSSCSLWIKHRVFLLRAVQDVSPTPVWCWCEGRDGESPAWPRVPGDGDITSPALPLDVATRGCASPYLQRIEKSLTSAILKDWNEHAIRDQRRLLTGKC